MNASDYTVRRATLDDLPALTALWNSMQFSVEDLGKRVTEFQVAEGSQGIAGAIGMQIAEKQGLLHSEAFTDFALADTIRPLLWDRLRSIAANYGLARLWTRESAPFWTRCGLVNPEPDEVQKLPAPWRNACAKWLTLKLRDDIESIINADKEFAVFMQTEKARSQRTLQQAKALKVVATLIAFGVFFLVLIGAFILLRRGPLSGRH